jgi:hypothetical protein
MATTIDLTDHKNLITFKQHGFIYKGQSGSQVYGYSVFSGKDNFWINPETKMWDCKNSGEEGGFKQFLKSVHKMSLDNMKGDKAVWLRNKRGFLRATLKHHHVGFNPHNETYLIPIFDANNDKIWDLRIYNPKLKKTMSTSGCTAGLYGWEILQKFKTVWLVEGEWDRMAMWEILYKTDRLKDEVVVSVPGANTFKQEWCQLLKGKTVYVAYDHDLPKPVGGILKPGAGAIGSVKVYKLLKNITKSIKFVHWKDGSKDGYDVNDHLNDSKSHEKAYDDLTSYIKSDPPIEEKFLNEVLEENKTDEEIFIGKNIPAVDVYKEYKKWFYLPDTTVIDVLFGTIIANRLEGDPLWLFLIAPSGGTKTEFCLSISEAPRIVSVTTMTPHSLISGASTGGGDPSLIPLLDEKVLVIKDFTTILQMNSTHRDEIVGILRDAYDGKTEKIFGNGIFRSYESKFGLIAGVTPKIELYIAGNTAFGERFLGYKIPISPLHKERLKYLARAMKNVNKETKMRQDLKEFGKEVLSYNYTKNNVNIPDALLNKLMLLAEWTATMRGSVERDTYSKEIVAEPFVELATRLVKQFKKFIIGVSLFRGKRTATRNEYAVIRDIAVGSVATDLNKITKCVYNKGKEKWCEYKEILEKTELSSENLRRKIENLVMLKVLHKKKSGLNLFYSINSEIHDFIKEGRIY